MQLRTHLFAGLLALGLCISSYGQSTSKPAQTMAAATKDSLLRALTGTWEIDLRPAPDAAPYLKEFVVSGYSDGSLSGVFYDTPFSDGKVNTAWGVIYFAFTTADQSGTYFHSGYLDGNKLYGQSFSTGRGFVIPWINGHKK